MKRSVALLTALILTLGLLPLWVAAEAPEIIDIADFGNVSSGGTGATEWEYLESGSITVGGSAQNVTKTLHLKGTGPYVLTGTNGALNVYVEQAAEVTLQGADITFGGNSPQDVNAAMVFPAGGSLHSTGTNTLTGGTKIAIWGWGDSLAIAVAGGSLTATSTGNTAIYLGKPSSLGIFNLDVTLSAGGGLIATSAVIGTNGIYAANLTLIKGDEQGGSVTATGWNYGAAIDSLDVDAGCTLRATGGYAGISMGGTVALTGAGRVIATSTGANPYDGQCPGLMLGTDVTINFSGSLTAIGGAPDGDAIGKFMSGSTPALTFGPSIPAHLDLQPQGTGLRANVLEANYNNLTGDSRFDWAEMQKSGRLTVGEQQQAPAGAGPGGDETMSAEEAAHWRKVTADIRAAAEGDTVAVDATKYPNLPYTVIDAAAGRAITLTLRYTGADGKAETATVEGRALTKSPMNRIYYPAAAFAKMYG